MVLIRMEKSTGYTKREDSLSKAIRIILEKNLALKQNESLVVIYDKKREDIAKRFKKYGDLLKIPIGRYNGQEPPKWVALQLMNYDAAVFLTTMSLSHTKARDRATKKGVRIASMPGVTKRVLERCIDVDYKKLKKNTDSMIRLLSSASYVKIDKGRASLGFSVKNRRGQGASAGIYSKKGQWGNLPEGEAFIAPVEGTAQGSFIVDGSIAGFGKCIRKTFFEVENGYVSDISGYKSEPIKNLLDKVGYKARNIAEFGIGLNKKAEVTGIVLEDEKAFGTCHIALGNNIGFGGRTRVPLHVDCVIRKPTIFLDKKKIMDQGTFLL